MAQPQRVRVRDPHVLRHCVNHPARITRYDIRDLAHRIGISRSALGYILKGDRPGMPLDAAQKFAETVGCHFNILFAPWTSTTVVDKEDQ